MSTENAQQPAFPTTSEGAAFGYQGLTKLEWFVGMALQGLLSIKHVGLDTLENGEYGNVAVKVAKVTIAALEAEKGGQHG